MCHSLFLITMRNYINLIDIFVHPHGYSSEIFVHLHEKIVVFSLRYRYNCSHAKTTVASSDYISNVTDLFGPFATAMQL